MCVSKCVSDVSKCVSDVSEWVSTWVSEWVHEWVSECMSEWHQWMSNANEWCRWVWVMLVSEWVMPVSMYVCVFLCSGWDQCPHSCSTAHVLLHWLTCILPRRRKFLWQAGTSMTMDAALCVLFVCIKGVYAYLNICLVQIGVWSLSSHSLSVAFKLYTLNVAITSFRRTVKEQCASFRCEKNLEIVQATKKEDQLLCRRSVVDTKEWCRKTNTKRLLVWFDWWSFQCELMPADGWFFLYR